MKQKDNTDLYKIEMNIQHSNLTKTHLKLNPNQTEGGPNGPPCRKIAISPEPNLRWTSDQSVNSSLSVVVQ